MRFKPQRPRRLASGKPNNWRQQAWAAGEYQEGATEPWVAQLVAEFAAAKRARVVLELGGFKGLTSLAIAERMSTNGGGQLIIVEIDPERCNAITKLFRSNPVSTAGVLAQLVAKDALEAIASLPAASVELAFVDDDHDAVHVESEIQALMPKMVPGGIILLHDVLGPFGLDVVVRRAGGVVLDFPRLHAAGGLGIITKEIL